MNCRDLEVLLSAYADGELSRTQREFIEEHLSGCAGCRETLAEFEAAGRRLASLRELPAASDISKSTLSKIKSSNVNTSKYRWRWLRPVTAVAAIVAVIAIMLVAQPWGMESPEAMAASIVRNSPEVQMALDGEEIEEVEVTTKIVDEENNVLMVLVKTEERVVTAEVNLDTKKVTEIIRVDMPDFKPGDEQRGIDIAKADPRVQELLAQGGIISEVHLSHALGKADGAVNGEWTATPTVFLSIKNDADTNVRWNVVVDLQAGEVRSIGRSQPSSAMIVVNISRFVSNFVAPVLLILGILLILGLSYNNKTAKKAAGMAALALGIIGLFMALYSLSSIWWRLVLSVGIPAVGLIIGIADLRQGGRRHWMPITGAVFSALALMLVFLNAIMLNINNVPGENIARVIAVAVVIAGILVYALKDRIMTLNVSGKWLKPALIGFAAIVVLIVAVVQPWGGSLEPKSVLAKTYTATEGLLSYRFDISGSYSPDHTQEARLEAGYSFPDRYHVLMTEPSKEQEEFIVIGEKQYVKNTSMSRNLISATITGFSSLLKKETTLSYLDMLTDIEELPDENINGTDTIHYRGTIDIEQQIAEARRSIQEARDRNSAERPTDEEIDRDLDGMRSVNTIIELWIGKDDYLIRKMTMARQVRDSGVWDTSSLTSFEFYDFNEPIVIEPPLDSDGALLEGWQLAGSITPDATQPVFSRNFTSSIGAQEGYDDYAHQEVKYSITITNNSIETVKDVRVTIATMLTDEAGKPATVEAEPETPADTIAADGSKTFHARCPFDATGLTKEEIIKLHDMATILVHFTTEDGRELTELLYPDAPYPTKTSPAAMPAD